MYSKFFDQISISFSKSKKAKRVIISVKPKKGVTVSVPRGIPFFYAESFVHEKLPWINRTLKAIKEDEKIFNPNEIVDIRGHKILILHHDSCSVNAVITNDSTTIFIPVKDNFFAEDIQQQIKSFVIAQIRVQAKQYLPYRLYELAKRSSLSYAKVSIRNNSSRWGSCSFKNNINLNLHLMRLPDHLIDYVLYHELAHTKIKNHSKEFWEFLYQICPNAKLLDKELKQHKLNW